MRSFWNKCIDELISNGTCLKPEYDQTDDCDVIIKTILPNEKNMSDNNN